jgi:Lrp/AsnC family transcriptional regulator for asnA, asnC and gidA
MDQLDEELIEYVDSGITRYSDLAKKVNSPLSTVHIRMKKLEQSGIIRGYKGDIDWSKAGFGITAYIFISIDVNLLQRLKKSQETLLKEILSMEYVKEGYIVTGDADIMVKILAKNTENLKEILLNGIDRIDGIVKTRAMITLY